MSSVSDLFIIFLKRIISDALEEHDEKVSIGVRHITKLRFADIIEQGGQSPDSQLVILLFFLSPFRSKYYTVVTLYNNFQR